MYRIYGSILTIGIVGALAIGGTGAFFSDTETSAGNTFAAGAIDLKIDNESYTTDQSGNLVFSSSTSWELKDLTVEKFFNFLDLKPGDRGEDTISLHVDTNDAYLCANVKLTSNDDNGLTEPEALIDSTGGAGEGELASEVNFIWWADDGDNVLESNESVISKGPIGALGLNGSTTVALADSVTNIWSGVGGPAPGATTLYIGKAWCFGNLTESPIAQDGLGKTGSNGPLNRGTGFTCDGSGLNNSTQTDSLTADVSFRAVQARNNPGFLCVPPVRATSTLTVVKIITNDNGGNNVVGDFHLFVDDGFVSTEVASGATTTLPAGTYSINETGVSGYVGTFSGDCDVNGDVTLAPGDHKTCILTNNDLPGNITLIKSVINNNAGTAVPTSFKLRIDGNVVPNNTSIAVTANAPHTISEDPRAGYHFVSITGNPKCPAVLGGSATLDEGESITCTITNDDN